MFHLKASSPPKITLLILFIILFISINAFSFENYTVSSPEYSITTDTEGYSSISMDGYYSYGEPGVPDLPCIVLHYAVPPDVSIQSISINYTPHDIQSKGIFNISPAPAMASPDGVIINNNKIYSTDGFFPKNIVEEVAVSTMRKWKYVTIKYTPFQYNPVTKELIYISGADFTIAYNLTDDQPAVNIADTLMDSRAFTIMSNYMEGESWYKNSNPLPAPSQTHNYVIITTDIIESNSTQLNNFVTHLGNRGFSPLVVTESDYGGLTGQSPNGTAEKIRQWLINNYVSYAIEYVLLIGNPDPDDPSSSSDSVGDIPMKMCWPRRTESSYRESPTDYFYADLTGNWDSDGDGYFGEYPDDSGVDFANEVYVGRIPVYSGVTDLDSVLLKIMGYVDSTDTEWRKTILLPMSYSDSTTDGAFLGEAMVNDYLTSNSFSKYRMYMHGGLCSAANSSFSSKQELLDGSTKAHWAANPYGMVFWWGHGSNTSAALGFSDCGWGTILSQYDTSALNDNYPAFVYQCSCNNGYPEDNSNLGAKLLYKGSATTVSASRVSWYAVASWDTSLKYYCDNASIGYYYGKELVTNSKNAGKALFDVKNEMGANYNAYWDGCHWMNLFDFNLYGDPALSFNLDTDGDGISDTIEKNSCTSSIDADTDDDGIPDGIEDANQNGQVDTGETNPCHADTDRDGIQDGTETGVVTPVADPDGQGPLLGTDSVIFIADADPSTTTNPLNDDSDGDNLTDGEEDTNKNGRVNPGETDPNIKNTIKNSKAMPWIFLLLSDK